MAEDRILSSVKNQQLVSKRRNQIIKGAMRLFQEKGFHRTTTREIAKESGFSIGTLYEYIRTKEDVLFLVCESIHDQVKDRIAKTMEVDNPSAQSMRKAIRSYFYLMDDMQDEILMLYQETKSLKKETRNLVLLQEKGIVDIMEKLLSICLGKDINEKEISLIANNIVVGGHMWGFRRWIIQKQFSLEEYINLQMKQVDQLAEIRKA